MACRNKDGQFQTVSGLLFVWITVGQYAEEGNMPKTICKIIKQYNKGPVASETAGNRGGLPEGKKLCV